MQRSDLWGTSEYLRERTSRAQSTGGEVCFFCLCWENKRIFNYTLCTVMYSAGIVLALPIRSASLPWREFAERVRGAQTTRIETTAKYRLMQHFYYDYYSL